MSLYKPYTTVALVQQECKNDESDLTAVYESAINSASRIAEDYCNRDWWYHDHASSALTVDPRWVVQDRIYLPWPVKTLTEVTVAGTALDTDHYGYLNPATGRGAAYIYRCDGTFASSGVAELSSLPNRANYPLGLADGLYEYEYIHGKFPQGVTNNPCYSPITITGTFGYTLADTSATNVMPTDHPEAVKRAVTLLAAVLSGENRKTVVMPDGDIDEVNSYRIPPEVKLLLKKHKRHIL